MSKDPKELGKERMRNTASLKLRLFKQVLYDLELSRAERDVALCIIDHIESADDVPYPSLDRIAAMLGMPAKSVWRCMQGLHMHFHIVKGRQGRGYSSRYHPIERPEIMKAALERAWQAREEKTSPGRLFRAPLTTVEKTSFRSNGQPEKTSFRSRKDVTMTGELP
jgi:biotin operon repressor